MKRLLLPLVFVALTAGCEDGPEQVFNASPEGAGSYWNDGKTQGGATNASQGYGTGGNTGANKNEICNAEKKHAVWAEMVKKPLLPGPGIAGGLDIAGGPNGDGTPDPNGNLATESWKGLTLDNAEAINCQSEFLYDAYGDGSVIIAGWGDQGEVGVWYRTSNRQITTVSVFKGYLGTLEFSSRDKAHKFSVSVDNQISKDGQPFSLDWKDSAKFTTEVNDLYDALSGTYSANASETDCIASGHCIAGDFGDEGAYLWFTPIGVTLNFATTNAAQPIPSKPTELDFDRTKLLGFSDADILLKNDDAGEGPTALRKDVFGTGKDCKFEMGMSFKDFRDDCVAPFPTSGKDKNDIEMAKLFGGLGHGNERYSFDIAGVDPNFSATLGATDVVKDSDRPKDADYASSLRVDQQSLGNIRNDFVGNDTANAQDWHGLGWVTLEWMNLVQKWFKAYDPAKYHYDLGAPACLVANPPAGCTGLEGVVTSAPRNARGIVNDRNALGPAAIQDPAGNGFSQLAIGLKPGRWYSFFCSDAGGLAANGTLSGYQNCVGGTLDPTKPTATYLFDTAYSQMVKVIGGGNINNMPVETRDVRFLFKNWIFAFVKYMALADKTTLTLAQLDAVPIDSNNLFFDAYGSGQFEFAEYVDRHNVNKGQDPLDLTITADVLHGIMNDYTFVRELYRGEELLYSTVLENPNDKIGYENTALLTSLFGSPAIKAVYPSYHCAINTNPADAECQGLVAPQDAQGFIRHDDGTLLLAPYKGVWGQTPFTLGVASPLKVNQVFPLIQNAMVEAPVHEDPYDPASNLLAPVSKLVPWMPKGAGIGFPVPINGSQEKWITTYQLDFSGTTVSANVNYDFVTTNGKTELKILGVETSDFLGEVFICADPLTGDLLRARMYSSAATIVDWVKSHPGSEQACQIVYRYSPYGNYLDFITSLTYGVRVGINPGAGGGRVVDVVLFDPKVVGQ